MDPADSDRLPRVRSYSGARREGLRSRVRDYHPLWSLFPELFRLPRPWSLPLIEESLVLQPRPDESRRFGLGPVRSPLLGPSRLLSFPGGTEMFQFPPFAPAAYGLGGWSFGNPGLNARWTAPPGLSQSSTPFIACRRQDIPHTPLVAWPRRPRPRTCRSKLRHRCSYRPVPGRSNDPSLISGLMQRFALESPPAARCRSRSRCEIATLSASQVVKDQSLVSRKVLPRRIHLSPSLTRGRATRTMARPAVREELPYRTCGDDGVRTRDLRLAKPALSQLSYIPSSLADRPQWAYLDSNQGPQLYQSCALAN